mmetsp:Transcript_119062/g.370906  ORF Transcript_119062/g.370906 Transcript_119062/m.370906 type:complete len:320 (+) Transcript_119062:51-1010(+)
MGPRGRLAPALCALLAAAAPAFGVTPRGHLVEEALRVEVAVPSEIEVGSRAHFRRLPRADPAGGERISEKGYSLVWSDEFDGGGPVDHQRWIQQSQRNGEDGNGELQFYTDREDNACQRDGHLHIVAKKEEYGGADYTSAKLMSKPGWLYGQFRIRSRFKGAWTRGLISAHWMMPVNDTWGIWPSSGGIDIMETFSFFHRVGASVQTEAHNHMIHTLEENKTAVAMAVDPREWHEYVLEWREDRILFAVDGKVYLAVEKEPGGGHAQWPFSEPFYLILNLSVGGSFFNGLVPIDDAALVGEGQTLEVDYVRVYQKRRKT